MRFDFRFSADATARSLTVGERQQLEIMRLLSLGVKVLILDEPTTAISATQRALLFSTLRRLADEGLTVIFVSHKLEEVEEICNRAAIIKQGRLLVCGDVRSLLAEEQRTYRLVASDAAYLRGRLLTIIDFRSRYLLAWEGLESTKDTVTSLVFARAFKEFRLPQRRVKFCSVLRFSVTFTLNKMYRFRCEIPLPGGNINGLCNAK